MSSNVFAAGDIVSLDFPFSDGADGKNRPALVLAGPSPHGDYTVAMISRSQQTHIHRLVVEVGAPLERVLAYFGVNALQEIKAADFSRVVRSLEKRRNAA